MPRGSKPKFTRAQDRRIADLYRAGQTSYEIAEKYNVSPTPVINSLKRQGVPIRAPGPRIYWTGTPSEREAVVVAYRDERESIRHISRRLKVRAQDIIACLNDAGIPRWHPGGRPMFDEETMTEIAAAYQAGAGMKELGRKFGSSGPTIRACLNRQGVTLRPAGGSKFWTADLEAEAVRRYEAGESQQDIANAFGRTQSNVSDKLRRAGVVGRGGQGSGAEHPSWQGGRVIDGHGYVRVKMSEEDRHLITPQGNGYVFEHRLEMARKLGRPLAKHETVHHIDGDTQHNDPANLQLRQGKHGRGVAVACLDCGSANIGAVPLH